MGFEYKIIKGIGYCVLLSELKKILTEDELDDIRYEGIDGINFIFQGNYSENKDTSILICCKSKVLSSLSGKSVLSLRGDVKDFVALLNDNESDNTNNDIDILKNTDRVNIDKDEILIKKEKKILKKLKDFPKLKEYLKNNPRLLNRWLVGLSC
jgi:hypothetical protein